MTNELLDQFGKCYVSEVRDDAIEHWSNVFSRNIKAPELLAICDLIHSSDIEVAELLKILVPKIVDSCLTRNLRMLEHHREFILTSAGENLLELSDGIVGELFGRRGWIAKYSAQPHDE